MTLFNPILSEWKWVGREIDRLPTPFLRLPLPLIDVSSHLWHRCKISNEVMRNKVKDCRKILPLWNITILKCYWTISSTFHNNNQQNVLKKSSLQMFLIVCWKACLGPRWYMIITSDVFKFCKKFFSWSSL